MNYTIAIEKETAHIETYLNRIICGRCEDVMKDMPSDEYVAWQRECLTEMCGRNNSVSHD